MPSLDFEREEARFHAFHEQNLQRLQEACASFVTLITALLSASGQVDVAKVEGRVKDESECIQKFTRKYRPALEESNQPYEIAPYISDLIGVRVVCLYEDELEKVAQLVRTHFEVMEVTDKVAAVEGTEASFGYKGLHLDLRLNATQRALPEHAACAGHSFELQVRTIIQDSWSVLDHKIKYKKSIPGQLKRRINVLSALFELADREFRQIRDATATELQRAPDETTEADTPSSLPAMAGSELNAFTFLKIAHHFFKDVEFDGQKVDQFVDDIRAWSPTITRARFNALMRETLATVKRYKQYYEERNPEGSFNPFTVMRHCLYLGDKQMFRRALRNTSRDAFDAWLQAAF